MNITDSHIIAKYHVIKVHPQDWDDRVEILKEMSDYFYYRISVCLNCEEVMADEEIEPLVTGNRENCPKCGKLLIEWKKSNDIGLEWMMDPLKESDRIIFETYQIVQKRLRNSWNSYCSNTLECREVWKASDWCWK